MKKYCENPCCEAEAEEEVAVSVNRPHDEKRSLCSACHEVYTWGVQHGRQHEAAVHGVKVGQDDSQKKPNLR